MKTKSKKKYVALLIVAILAIVFICLCWWKRKGIYYTYLKMTNQEEKLPYEKKEVSKKEIWLLHKGC